MVFLKRYNNIAPLYVLIFSLTIFVSFSCHQEKRSSNVSRCLKDKKEVRLANDIFNNILSQERKRSDSYQSEKSWPEAVRLASYELFESSFDRAPFIAQRLAQMGLPAVPAMKFIIDSKKQSVKKRAMISFLMVQMHMFRIYDLEPMALDPSRPFIQRAAIEVLANIGNKKTNDFLLSISTKLRKNTQTIPLAEFIESSQAISKRSSWSYSSENLSFLDNILQASSDQELFVALDCIKDLSLEKGLHAILSSPVARLETQVLLARKMATLASNDQEKLRLFCSKDYSPLLRKDSSRLLISGASSDNLFFLEKMAKDPLDPLSEYFKKLVKNRVMQSIHSTVP